MALKNEAKAEENSNLEESLVELTDTLPAKFYVVLTA